MTTTAFTPDAYEHVEIGRVEHLLTEMWRQSEGREDGRPVAWVRVLNLVVIAEDERALDLAERLAYTLPGRHPCRMLVVHITDTPGADMDASLFARCATAPGGRREVCCETVTITAGRDARRYTANAVAALLVSGLPVVVWWAGRARPDDAVFRSLTTESADHVIVDSSAGAHDALTLGALAAWLREGHHHAVLGDLAWARVRPWRQVVAGFFDPAPTRALASRIRDVEVTCEGEVLSADALLMLGWLAARLRWRLLDVTREGAAVRAVYRGPDQLIDVRLRDRPPAAGDSAARMVAVQLLAGVQGSSYTFRAHRAPGTHRVHTHVLSPNQPDFERAESMPEWPDEILLGDLLAPRGRDTLYEDALARAAELAAMAAQ